MSRTEGEIRTEEGKDICAGATLMATHAYTRNPESPLGKEIDLQQWDTLIFKGEHAENEHWRLVDDRNGQVGYAPAAFLVVILDTTAEEEENGATKKGQENSTEENEIGGWIGQEGERRKSYSAAVIDGIKRNSRIYVGDSIVRKTDTRLSKGEDVVVCLPGARIEDVTERVEEIMGRGNGGSILVHIGTNNADREGTTAILEKYRNLLKKTKQARVGQIILSGILPVFGNSWVDFDSSGCTNSWAEMRGGNSVFTCNVCREVTRLVGEVEDLRQMMESMKRIVTGLGLEEKGEETGDRIGRTGRSGEVRRSDYTRQLDRRKPEGKGDSGKHFIGR